MAELLKRQYDLVVLKAELLRESDGRRLAFTLQSKESADLRDVQRWEFGLDELGLHEGGPRRGDPDPQLPATLLSGLRYFYATVEKEAPLWVHLVAPYGTLKFVAWERLLGAAIDAPILMLPDFLFPPPLDTEEELEVLVCGSAPLGHEHWSIQEAVRQTVERIVSATGRSVRIHVFTDRAIADVLRDAWTSGPALGKTILIHDPETAAPFVDQDDRPAPASGLRSPWLRWMQSRLRGHAIDVAHFVCHGYLARGHGALLFAQSPLDRSDRFLAGPVTSADLQTFLTSTGAWATAFTSVTDNLSESGLRAVADDVAQSRPGPMLMVTMHDDPQGQVLAATYRFLFGPTRSLVPRSQALLLYCQPYLVAPPTISIDEARRRTRAMASDSAPMVARNDAQMTYAARALTESPLSQVYASAPRVTPLVAATARFAEEVHLKYQRLSRDQIASVSQCDHDAKIALDTVDRLSRFVADRAAKDGGR